MSERIELCDPKKKRGYPSRSVFWECVPTERCAVELIIIPRSFNLSLYLRTGHWILTYWSKENNKSKFTSLIIKLAKLLDVYLEIFIILYNSRIPFTILLWAHELLNFFRLLPDESKLCSRTKISLYISLKAYILLLKAEKSIHIEIKLIYLEKPAGRIWWRYLKYLLSYMRLKYQIFLNLCNFILVFAFL